MSITLVVEASSGGSGDSYARIEYSIDGGSTWFLLNTGGTWPYSKANYTATISPADLPSTNQLSAIQVRASGYAAAQSEITGSEFGDPVYSWFSSEVVSDIYEIRLDTTYHT